MPRTNFQELLDAGVHFGHLARKWNPKMAPYIFDQKNGIHIIDLHKSIVKIEEAANVLKHDPSHTHVRIFFVPSLRGHPVELLGWVEWGNLWGRVHRRTLFPRDVVSLSVRRQGMRSDLSESAHSFLSCRKDAFDPSGATVL